MDVIFDCPKCEQELAVDSSGAGTEIDCPSCGEPIIIPQPNAPGARLSGEPSADGSAPRPPIAASAAAKVEKHLKVPLRATPTESLITKPLAPLDVTAKESDKKIRVKSIRHTDCVEVGHDKFDEVVSNFLVRVGETNIISITPLSYSHVDIGSQKLLTDYGLLIIYRG